MPATCQDLSIRPFTDRDVSRVIAIDQATFNDPLSGKKFRQYTRVEDEHQPKYGRVAVCGRQVVGFLLLEAGETCVEVQRFAVHPTYRRQGIGKKLFGWLADDIARSSSYHQARLLVRETNLPAQLFLRACRWLADDVLRDAYLDGDESAFQFTYTVNREDSVSHPPE